MSRVLVVETASPLRVRRKVEALLAPGPTPQPEVTVLCRDDRRTAAYFGEIRGVRVVALDSDDRGRILAAVRKEQFDEVHVFWSGETRYRGMKWTALRFRGTRTWVDAGDGNVFRLTWKACIRFGLFRTRHRLPSDHAEFVPPPEVPEPAQYYEGERVLVVQSAEPHHVLRALETIRSRRLLREPRFTVFCRNRPEIARHFDGHPLVPDLRTHSEARGALRHLRELRAQRFDAVVVFFTGDPSYWKIKYFAFLTGARHRLIFNENGDCFFFSLGTWLALLARRLGERSRPGARPRWTEQAGLLSFLVVKTLLLPFRFAWLLLVWLRLRIAG